MVETAGSIMAKMMKEQDPEKKKKLRENFLSQSESQLGGGNSNTKVTINCGIEEDY